MVERAALEIGTSGRSSVVFMMFSSESQSSGVGAKSMHHHDDRRMTWRV
jgi:hypothetical protein